MKKFDPFIDLKTFKINSYKINYQNLFVIIQKKL